MINVGLDVKCQGGSGEVVVNVMQSPLVKGHRPQRVRPAPARHELQVPVH
jgi:hypothetical protein